jgi:hypothetical protein
LLTLIYYLALILQLIYNHWIMVLVKPSMVLEVAMVVANLFMVILHVYPL